MSAEHLPYAERAAVYAEYLSKRFQNGLLKSMQDKPLWGLYRMEQDEKGNWHKRPYQPNGRAASKQRHEQWASLHNVLEALSLAKFPVSGIGMLLPAPYVLLDLDAKDTPIYDRQARKIVSPLALRVLSLVPSYAELSPHYGLHIITTGIPKHGNFKTRNLEMYTNWFSTVTTRHIPGTPLDVMNRQKAIEALENEFHPITPETLRQNTGGAFAGRGSEVPPEARNHRLLHDLLSGDLSAYGGDESTAEFVCLMILMHYTGDDRAWAKAIFSSHPIGQRAKARTDTREGRRGDTTYLDYTIDAVLKKRRNPPMRR